MSDSVTIICVAILIILCVGEPDLLDTIIKRVGTVECATQTDQPHDEHRRR